MLLQKIFLWAFIFLPWIIPPTVSSNPTLIPEGTSLILGMCVFFSMPSLRVNRLQLLVFTYGMILFLHPLSMKPELPLLYCTWAALLCTQQKHLSICDIAWPLTITSLCTVFLGYVQFFQPGVIPLHLHMVTYQEGMSGIIGQRNVFANIVACGLASVCYLQKEGRISPLCAQIMAMFLVSGLAFSGARVVWLYLGLLLLLYGRILIGPILVLLMLKLWPNQIEGTVKHPELQGLIDNNRMILWQQALDLWLQHPLIGAGFLGFREYSLQFAPLYGGKFDRNAHNVILQTATEAGLAGVLILIVFVITVIRNVSRNRLVWSILGIQAIHSMIEFPLWYTQLLGLTAVTIALSIGVNHDLKDRT